MTVAVRSSDIHHRSSLRSTAVRVFTAAAVVFVLDGLYAVVVFAGILHATTPMRIFQGIARALLGPAAFDGGWSTAALGVVLHFLVGLGWSAAWTAIYDRVAVLRRAAASTPLALLLGAAWGGVVHLAMQLVVLPLTRVPTGPITSRGALLVLVAHLLVVGPPIVLLVRGHVSPP